ncbi:DNA polymerase III subunit alpha [Thermomicrobium roseum]|jgi:error-prone DNA polymerase|uniref:DNA-directed DNA polymerase n=1 Tax=Thermomicrobium roseum (strain ATCC 27502 / DSM 5159 / P-2) TaxID=309801 RepID=B9L411_THERP|nr:error-prone DNA polymerase [Thermomicrobium roseum]ACM06625.1 error-prone DNA polymerase [Thermomicrobium roseum DSM 5159]
MGAPYAELHAHSCFSLLDAPCHPEQLVQQAAALGYEHLALTDHDALHGVVRFVRAAERVGIHPIVGAEITMEDGSHLALLAEDERGYATLARLLSAARLGWPTPEGPGSEDTALAGSPARRAVALPWHWLVDHHDGLIVLTGCRQGPLARALTEGNRADALARAHWLARVFGPERCFVELQDHGERGDRERCTELAALARTAGLPLVATGNVHYLDAAGWRLQDVLVCIREGITIETPHPARKTSAAYRLVAPASMAHRFRSFPDAVANTRRIAERCQVSLDFRQVRFPPLPHLVPPGETPMQVLRRQAYEGAQRRYGQLSEPVVRQLEHELGVIERLGVAEFFLICADLANRFRGRGRGSAADSLVAYCLGITQVDPLAHRLLFERFLNEERPSMPDIDIDFGLEDRERAIAYVYATYGVEHAAMVCNYVTFQARSAIRDLGRVLGLPPEIIDELAKSQGRLGEALPVLARALAPRLSPDLRRRLAWLVRLVPQLEDIPRHLSVHVGGMVIAGRPVVEFTTVEPSRMPGRVVLGWDKRDIEEAGLIKTDVLCVRAISVVHQAIELIEQASGLRIDLEQLPLDDPAVYRLLQTADTIGTYQVESRAQQQSLPRTHPERFEDLIAQVAIIRPGPIQGGMVHPYIRRRRGLEPVRYLHPKLEPILRETLGVILYQEQVLEVAMAIAGMTAGQADAFRRAMGSKRSRAAMEALRGDFLAGAERNGVARPVAERIFEQIAAFAEYGFCKSHAAALARTAYETLWLRAHYPAALLCALLNNQPMGFYAPEVLIWDALRRGIHVLPPDVLASAARSTLTGDPVHGPVRLGLTAVRGVGRAAAERIVAARSEEPFRDTADVVRRAQLTPEQVEALVLVGAFDRLAPDRSRRELLWDLLAVATERPERPRLLDVSEPAVRLPELDTVEQTFLDYAILGFCLDRHLMELYRAQRRILRVTPAARLRTLPPGATARVAGLVVCRQAPPTARGVLFLTLEDETGLVNVIVPPPVREQHRALLRRQPVLVIDGRVEREGALASLVAEEVRPLGRPLSAQPTRVRTLSHDFR